MLYVDTHKNTIHRYYDDDHIPMNLKPISRPSCSKTELFSKSSNRIENIPEAIIMGVCVYICSSGGGGGTKHHYTIYPSFSCRLLFVLSLYNNLNPL